MTRAVARPEATIARKLLLVHQHLHVDTPRGIGTYQHAVGAIRLIADHFTSVVNLTPVRDPEPGEDLAAVALYPPTVVCKRLYKRRRVEPRARVALRHLAAMPAIVREVRHADVIQVRLPSYPAVLASLAAMALGKDMLVSIHGDWGQVLQAQRGPGLPWRWLARLSERYQRLVSRRSILTLVTGTHNLRLAGPDAALFADHQLDDADLHERADTCQGDTIRLLYVGLLSPSKGTDDLLDALRQLVDQGLPCTLTLAGATRDYDIDRAIARRGLQARVTLAGHVPWGPALFDLHRESDIFVFPSLSEGLPKAPMEALGQGLPVVATPPGSEAYIRHEETGLLVPVADARALAAAVRRLVDDGALRRACIARGLAVARDNTRTRTQERIGRELARVFAGRRAGGLADEGAP
jgi:glycosyltransferase involved in cell wall biosynthesis